MVPTLLSLILTLGTPAASKPATTNPEAKPGVVQGGVVPYAAQYQAPAGTTRFPGLETPNLALQSDGPTMAADPPFPPGLGCAPHETRITVCWIVRVIYYQGGGVTIVRRCFTFCFPEPGAGP